MITQVHNIDWEGLTNKIDLLDIRILEQLYVPKATATTLMDLTKSLKKYNINKMRISRRLRRLEGFGIIKLIKKTNPLGIWGLPEIGSNVKKLIVGNKKWLGIE